MHFSVYTAIAPLLLLSSASLVTQTPVECKGKCGKGHQTFFHSSPGHVVTLQIRKNLKLKAGLVSSKEAGATALELRESTTDKVFQTLALSGEMSVDETAMIEAKDYNFDGWNDLAVVENLGASGNISYVVFLYDPANQAFQYSSEASQLTTPRLDAHRRIIREYVRGGGPDEYEASHRWQTGRLQIFWEKTSNVQHGPNGSVRWIVCTEKWRLANGKWKERVKKRPMK